MAYFTLYSLSGKHIPIVVLFFSHEWDFPDVRSY